MYRDFYLTPANDLLNLVQSRLSYERRSRRD